MTLKPLQPLQPQLLPRRTSTQSTCCRKEEPKIPSQDSIYLFSIETSSVPKFRVQFNPTVNHSPRELQGKITRNCFTFRFTRYHRVNFHRSGIWSKRHVSLRTYDLNTDRDLDCRKQHTHSLEVSGAFGVPATAREAVGESLDGEFCQRGACRPHGLVKKRNSPIGRKTVPPPLTS
jgi:hypothetical protein